MKKKMIFSVAAAAALLMANPVANKADAASNCPTSVQPKVNYQIGNLNCDQLNSILQQYMQNFNIQWNVPINCPVQQSPVQVQQPVYVQQPAGQTQQPVKAPVKQQPAKKQTTQTTSQVSAYEQKVVELTNKERAKYGLPALKLDVQLSKVAREKSRDMQAKGYFSHYSPTYGSPFDMMKQFGITYRSAGENIAMGQRSPEEVVQAWMNSDGHRRNILNSSFTHIGVGYVANGNYWTQMFIGK
ncbi:sporulation protein [Bacillus methanolicus]|uniref:CAP domain-containing protein n=1 Tax=Bacillus methanolicus TaxID=1471 RepID=UPI00200CC964|nr:CAP domain-containing protein [Bacillus methanolicus]UQD52413.1 sporulation protein [Bacillus methanolicus]